MLILKFALDQSVLEKRELIGQRIEISGRNWHSILNHMQSHNSYEWILRPPNRYKFLWNDNIMCTISLMQTVHGNSCNGLIA